MWPPKTILLATDFSENSQQAFEFACQLASSSGSKVIVLHAYTPDIVALRDMPPMPVEIENEDDAHRKLAQIQVRQPGVIVEHKLVKGTAVEVIVHAAQSTGADLIVMGTYGRSGLKRFFLGSVADHVLRRAPCPVLIVPLRRQVEMEMGLSQTSKAAPGQTCRVG